MRKNQFHNENIGEQNSVKQSSKKKYLVAGLYLYNIAQAGHDVKLVTAKVNRKLEFIETISKQPTAILPSQENNFSESTATLETWLVNLSNMQLVIVIIVLFTSGFFSAFFPETKSSCPDCWSGPVHHMMTALLEAKLVSSIGGT